MRGITLTTFLFIFIAFQSIESNGQDGLPCDANGSGAITAADVTALINDLRNRAPAAGNADCNNSGTVTAADVTALINVLRGRTQPPNGNGQGSIQGMVTSSSDSPLNAVHVRAVNVSDSNIQISSFSGIGRNLTFENGVFHISGVPSGDYRVLIEKLDGRSLAFEDTGYSPFVRTNSPQISFPDEYFNKDSESATDDPLEFEVVTVTGGQTTQNINIITNDSGLPPSVCQSPPLNTDFSDRGVFFVDSINAVLIGITSDGNLVSILLADIPDSGVQVALEGNVLSSTVCNITLGQVMEDGMVSPITDATGACRLEGNSTVFVIEDLVVGGIPLGVDLRGECDQIVSLGASSESLNSLNKAMLDKLQKMTDRQITTEEKGLILDFHEDIIKKIGE